MMQLLDDYTIAHIVESMIPVAVRDGVYDEMMSNVMRDLCKLARTSKRMHDIVEPIIRKYASMSLLVKNHSDDVVYVYVNYRGWKHRVDGPAVVYASGRCAWYRNDKLHREDGPAVEYASGKREWYLNGLLHREDGPAVKWSGGTREWYRNGLHHREDGPAVECASGMRQWYRDGLLHREDGPAVEWASGSREWYHNDKRHREDGPAIEYADGTREWHLHGVLICEEHVK